MQPSPLDLAPLQGSGASVSSGYATRVQQRRALATRRRSAPALPLRAQLQQPSGTDGGAPGMLLAEGPPTMACSLGQAAPAPLQRDARRRRSAHPLGSDRARIDRLRFTPLRRRSSTSGSAGRPLDGRSPSPVPPEHVHAAPAPAERRLSEAAQLGSGGTRVSAVGQRVTVIDTLPPQWRAAEVLFVSNNALRSLSGVEQLRRLHTLSAVGNMLGSFESIEPLHGLPLLQVLSLENNPVTQLPHYRCRTAAGCAALVTLDGTDCAADRRAAQRVLSREEESLQALCSGHALLALLEQAWHRAAVNADYFAALRRELPGHPSPPHPPELGALLRHGVGAWLLRNPPGEVRQRLQREARRVRLSHIMQRRQSAGSAPGRGDGIDSAAGWERAYEVVTAEQLAEGEGRLAAARSGGGIDSSGVASFASLAAGFSPLLAIAVERYCTSPATAHPAGPRRSPAPTHTQPQRRGQPAAPAPAEGPRLQGSPSGAPAPAGAGGSARRSSASSHGAARLSVSSSGSTAAAAAAAAAEAAAADMDAVAMLQQVRAASRRSSDAQGAGAAVLAPAALELELDELEGELELQRVNALLRAKLEEYQKANDRNLKAARRYREQLRQHERREAALRNALAASEEAGVAARAQQERDEAACRLLEGGWAELEEQLEAARRELAREAERSDRLAAQLAAAEGREDEHESAAVRLREELARCEAELQLQQPEAAAPAAPPPAESSGSEECAAPRRAGTERLARRRAAALRRAHFLAWRERSALRRRHDQAVRTAQARRCARRALRRWRRVAAVSAFLSRGADMQCRALRAGAFARLASAAAEGRRRPRCPTQQQQQQQPRVQSGPSTPRRPSTTPPSWAQGALQPHPQRPGDALPWAQAALHPPPHRPDPAAPWQAANVVYWRQGPGRAALGAAAWPGAGAELWASSGASRSGAAAQPPSLQPSGCAVSPVLSADAGSSSGAVWLSPADDAAETGSEAAELALRGAHRAPPPPLDGCSGGPGPPASVGCRAAPPAAEHGVNSVRRSWLRWRDFVAQRGGRRVLRERAAAAAARRYQWRLAQRAMREWRRAAAAAAEQRLAHLRKALSQWRRAAAVRRRRRVQLHLACCVRARAEGLRRDRLFLQWAAAAGRRQLLRRLESSCRRGRDRGCLRRALWRWRCRAVAALRRSAAECTARRAAAEQQLDSERARVAAIARQNIRLVEAVSTAADEAAQLQLEVSALQREADELRGAAAAARVAERELEERAVAAEASLAERRAEAEALRDELDRDDALVTEHEAARLLSVRAADRQIQALSEELGQIEGGRRETEAELLEVRRELHAAQEAGHETTQAMMRVTGQLRRTVAEQHEAIARLDSERAEQQAATEAYREELLALQARETAEVRLRRDDSAADEQARADGLRRQVSRAAHELTAAQADAEGRQFDVQRLRHALRIVEQREAAGAQLIPPAHPLPPQEPPAPQAAARRSSPPRQAAAAPGDSSGEVEELLRRARRAREQLAQCGVQLAAPVDVARRGDDTGGHNGSTLSINTGAEVVRSPCKISPRRMPLFADVPS
eukprot:TRINITY_DN17392_c0_g1_i1.p1 TRINITY_DN17392_c0_g1~~TRINITY_DN17392_c0_g1_i1.p1  ORF type:complete len:1585 (+),score=464.71 TRINITY_DN17392_c0_g1_i1:75-4757(+)